MPAPVPFVAPPELPKVEVPVGVQSRPPPVSPDQVVLPRRPNTEEAEEVLEVSSETLLAMTDQELHSFLEQLGINLPAAWARDKMIEVIMKIAISASDG